MKKNKGNTAWILDGYFPCEKAKSPVYDPQVVKDWISRIDTGLSDKNIEGTNETAMGSVLMRLAYTLGYILPETIILNSAEEVANEDMINTLRSLQYGGQIIVGPKSDVGRIKGALTGL
ncbi:hypothetical protein KBB89_03970 [Candidatus Gracilibacteria bacterium]|nr:hypothetical protein [Candidatus Gracilibacteria bacterium]